MKKEQTDKLFDRITANGCREMTKARFHQAVNEAIITTIITFYKKIEKKIRNNETKKSNTYKG